MRKILICLLLGISSTLYALDGINIGDKVDLSNIKDIDGGSLTSKGTKTILVFYRGSWCPFCIRQLKGLNKELAPKTKEYNLVGISVDKLKVAKKMKDRFNLDMQIVSDPKANTLKQFGIVNKLDDKLVDKYKTAYKIDVEADSGEKHHMVAHPAVFIIDSNSKVTFKDVHKDYKQRTPVSKILNNL